MADPKRADLLLACMPRSGSTMLACLLDVRPRQVFLLEPCRDGRRKLAANEAAAVATAARWGCKEVAAQNIRRAHEVFRPQRIVCLVRDIRQCAASMHEWIAVHGHPGGMGLETAASVILQTADLLCQWGRRCEVWRYEELVTRPQEHVDRLAAGGWRLGPLDYKDGCWAVRPWEAKRHGRAFSPASLELRRWEGSQEARHYVLSVLNEKVGQQYQACFHYPTRLDG